MTAHEVIDAFIAWEDAYPSAAGTFATSLLKRLAHEGYVVVPVAEIREVRRQLRVIGMEDVPYPIRKQLADWEELQQKQFAGKVP